ncbi:hypothetical protein EC973_002185 [Apophysomyces ossiformis]|uniref:Protein phosphatase 1 regulatory subunit 21 C-terminal domain-containing protein n=1 Tax=Apophysomyces ossiformis TaxID=679940 RepID=A0A8H7EV32_9FUNG|nr:hypothetical protein EC973_002185 [Apophysomyces ossiformis]
MVGDSKSEKVWLTSAENLHEELSEVRHIYTDHVNGLHAQIAEFEKRIEELQMEISTLQNERRNQTSTLKQEKAALVAEVEQLKELLNEKNKLITENEDHMRASDVHLKSEIESLRAILLAKIGDIEKSESDDRELPSLESVIPASKSLEALENQARDYIYALREGTTLRGLPHQIAERLKIASESWSEELHNLITSLKSAEARTKELLDEKSHNQKVLNEQKNELTTLQKTIGDLRSQLEQQQGMEKITELQNEKAKLEEQMRELKNELEQSRKTLESSMKKELEISVRSSTEEPPKLTADKETQADFLLPEKVEGQAKEEEEDEEDVFVYPVVHQSDEENEDIFVYNGEDAPETNKHRPLSQESTAIVDTKESEQKNMQQENSDNAEVQENKWTEEDALAREATLTNHYENQIRQLTEKLQMADSKAVRYAKKVDILEGKLKESSDIEENLRLELEKLQKDYLKVEDQLATTEKNYQAQLDDMTVYLSALQQQKQDPSNTQAR